MNNKIGMSFVGSATVKGLTLFLLFTLSACLKDSAPQSSSSSYYDPKLPGGLIGNSIKKDLKSVTALQADASKLGVITLNWKVPSLYETQDYTISIYKKNCVLIDPNCTIPDPRDPYEAAELFRVSDAKSSSFEDNNNDTTKSPSVQQGSEYSYWVYVKVGERWSQPATIGVKAALPGADLFLASPTDFWTYKKWNIGQKPILFPGNPTPFFNLFTLSPGPTTPASPKGGFALARNGNVMFVADTDNNRVVIYARRMALACDGISDTVAFQACLYTSGGTPFEAVNVIGQPDQYSKLACGEVGALDSNECLTKPTKVTVDGNRLLISDTGNNRIVVWNHLPVDKGCDVEVFPGVRSERDCTPAFVVGKKDLFDMASYAVATDGDAAFNFPTDLLISGGDLYVSDTHNNRVVKVKKYSDQSYYDCTSPGNWRSSCKFSAVLGQFNLFQSMSFKAIAASNNDVFNPDGLGNTLTAKYSGALKHYFANPGKLVMTPEGKLLLASYEDFSGVSNISTPMQLKARILQFASNPIGDDIEKCNASTFTSGLCDAQFEFGQTDWDTIPAYSSPGGTYSSTFNYGLNFIPDFFITGTQMLAVDSAENSVLMWSNYSSTSAAGKAYDAKVENPRGSLNPRAPGALPDLQSLSSIVYSPDTGLIYVGDSKGSYIYEVRAYTF